MRLRELLFAMLIAVFGHFAALPLAAEEEEKGFVEIFDGETLAGWKQDPVGRAKYEVVDGVIVGTTVEGSPNSFLLSEKQYGDFELQFEVKVDTELNSGVQIRSRPKTAADIAADEKGKKNEKPGRVFGPQVEIEASPGQSGYLYGEATGTGWLSKEPGDKGQGHAHDHIKNDEWNEYRVVARGPKIETWINGEKVATLVHEEIYKTHPKGHIGLQVHGIKKGTGPFRVRWRNLRVRELEAGLLSPAGAGERPAGFEPLFDGKSLAGWTTEKEDHFWGVDAEGNLWCDHPGIKKVRGGFIWTEREYGDFVLDLEFKMSEGCNSGVFIRTDPKNPVQGGFEIQVLDSAGKGEIDSHDCGALYDAVVPSVNAAKPAGEWNRMEITCDGPKVTVVLNGQKVVGANLDEWTTPKQNPDGSKNKFKTALKDLPRTGKIGLQEHGKDVWYRNINLKRL